MSEALELEACFSFSREVFANIPDNTIQFQFNPLKNIIPEVCLGSSNKRRIILLYLHNRSDPFSIVFMRNLKKSTIRDLLKDNFCIIGWDITNETYHQALIDALKVNKLDDIVPYVCNNIGVAFFLNTVMHENSKEVVVLSSMKEDISDRDFHAYVNRASQTLTVEQFEIIEGERNAIVSLQNSTDSSVIGHSDHEKSSENALQIVSDEQTALRDDTESFSEVSDYTSGYDDQESKNNLTYTVQQQFCDLLGNRDYDTFEYDQHKYLEKKIGFAIAGAPIDENGYSDGVKKEITKLYNKIRNKSNQVSEYEDKIELAVIYNIIEPLPCEKIKKAKKIPNYNPDEDITPLPVFVIRKCRGSNNPCRIFIDHIGRVYKTWAEYLEKNKLPKCLMTYPKNGRYEDDTNLKVLLETRYSPECQRVVNILDKISVAGGLVSSSAGFVTAVLPASAAAVATPVVAPVVAATGVVVGAYSIVRSSMVIDDRREREESINFFESAEARQAYMNIVACSLGFITAGTNFAFLNAVSKGIGISEGVKYAVNTVNIASLVVGGTSVANSLHHIISQWVTKKQRPSTLTVLQLTSNLLFFSHAAVNFKTATAMIDEIQSTILKEYADSLTRNKKETFDKLLKETVRANKGNLERGRANVIAALRNIPNKNEVLATLTGYLPKLREKGIEISIQGSGIRINGVLITVGGILGIAARDDNIFKRYTSVNDSFVKSDLIEMRNIFRFNRIKLDNINKVVKYAESILRSYAGCVKEKIISALANLLTTITDDIHKTLMEIMEDKVPFKLFQTVMNYFALGAREFEEQYQLWRSTKCTENYSPLFDNIDVQQTKRKSQFMEAAVNICFESMKMKDTALSRLIKYFHEWFLYKYNDYRETQDRKSRSSTHSREERLTTVRTHCEKCGGYYFQNK